MCRWVTQLMNSKDLDPFSAKTVVSYFDENSLDGADTRALSVWRLGRVSVRALVGRVFAPSKSDPSWPKVSERLIAPE
jgi:hypothetical protein